MNEDSEYNEIPVYYCRTCMSLRIMRSEDNSDECYCGVCCSTNIGRTDIFTYLRKLKECNSIYNRKNSIGEIKKWQKVQSLK